jgi:hypothetical protein
MMLSLVPFGIVAATPILAMHGATTPMHFAKNR